MSFNEELLKSMQEHLAEVLARVEYLQSIVEAEKKIEKEVKDKAFMENNIIDNGKCLTHNEACRRFKCNQNSMHEQYKKFINNDN